MLFDLQARGRRRMIKVVYATLAILMGGGLVFFGIGGDVSGGLFDALGLREGGGTTSTGSDVFERREEQAQKRVQANPRDAAGWAALTRARYQLAGQGDAYDQNTGAFTVKGRAQLREAERAWDRYQALKPPKPDTSLARLMLQAFGPAGLNKPEKAVGAAEIVTEADPSANAFFQLAVSAYQAGQTRKGDLARGETLRLTPKDDRQQVREQLDQAKTPSASGAGATGGAATPPPASP